MQAIQSFAITASSAAYGTRLVYRKGRRDVSRRYRQLTSPAAIATYRWLWSGFMLLCTIAVVLGRIARIQCDRLVEDSLTQPQVPVLALPPVSEAIAVEVEVVNEWEIPVEPIRVLPMPGFVPQPQPLMLSAAKPARRGRPKGSKSAKGPAP